MDLLKYALNRAEERGAFQAEIYESSSDETHVLYEKKQLKVVEQKEDTGVGVRVAVKRRKGLSVGFFYTNDLTEDAVSEAIDKALSIAKAKKPDPDFHSFQEKLPLGDLGEVYDTKIPRIDPENVVALAKRQIEAATSQRGIETTSGHLLLGEYEIRLTNSLGVEGSYRTTNFYSYCFSLAKDGDSLGRGWEEYANCFYNEDEALACSESAATLAIDQLHAKPMEKGKTSLILPPSAVAQIAIYLLAQMLRADNVQRNQSAFAGKIGEEVGSDALTLIDDGRVPRAVGSKLFDDEGCPTRRTTLIEKGVLKSYLHNTYTAHKDGVENTGNAYRASVLNPTPKYTLEPLIGPTNLVLNPGSGSQESLIQEVEEGVYAKGFIGAHTANTASGDFSLVLDTPFKIEKGERTHAVKEAMVGGNIIDFLKNVEAVGNDVKQYEFNLSAAMLKDSALISPTILVKDISISA